MTAGDPFAGLSRIRIEHPDDPVRKLADDDAARAWQQYPRVCCIGPAFGAAEHQDGHRWRVLCHSAPTLQDARDDLASFYRRLAKAADDPALGNHYEAAYTRLDWEKTDDLSAGGKRTRVIRIERFIHARAHVQEPELPRPTDLDPIDPQQAEVDRTKGFVLDPYAPSGSGNAKILQHMLSGAYPASVVPADVGDDSLRATHDYPGGALLPAEFAVGERTSDHWEPLGHTEPSPEAARRMLASQLRFRATRGREHHITEQMWRDLGLPMLDRDEQRLYLQKADQIDQERPDHVTVPGRNFSIVRVMRLVRFSLEGPEPPRPSDPDPRLPVEAASQEHPASY